MGLSVSRKIHYYKKLLTILQYPPPWPHGVVYAILPEVSSTLEVENAYHLPYSMKMSGWLLSVTKLYDRVHIPNYL